VQFPAQALPFEIDLAHGPARGAVAPVSGEGGKIALGELQAEMMPQQAALQVEQPGGHGGRHPGIYPGACSSLYRVNQVFRIAGRRARPFAHPEHVAT
jgi:hypothetical protein